MAKTAKILSNYIYQIAESNVFNWKKYLIWQKQSQNYRNEIYNNVIKVL